MTLFFPLQIWFECSACAIPIKIWRNYSAHFSTICSMSSYFPTITEPAKSFIIIKCQHPSNMFLISPSSSVSRSLSLQNLGSFHPEAFTPPSSTIAAAISRSHFPASANSAAHFTGEGSQATLQWGILMTVFGFRTAAHHCRAIIQ